MINSLEEQIRNICDIPVAGPVTTYFIDKAERQKKYGHIKPYKRPALKLNTGADVRDKVKKAWARRKAKNEPFFTEVNDEELPF